MSKPFSIVTGASAGIGLELAAISAPEGFDAADVAHGSFDALPPASRWCSTHSGCLMEKQSFSW